MLALMHKRFETIDGPIARPRVLATRFAAFLFSVLLLASVAAHAAAPDAAAAVDFKQAYESAMANAKGADTLDPAYELLGVAGNARERNLKDMADGAATAFDDLVQRATATALHKGGSTAQDALDQMVDLRFFAETTQIEKTVSTLDAAMRQLFPVVAKGIEQRLDTAQNWDDKLTALRDLATIEASSTQVLLSDVATPIGASFDRHIAALEAKANAQQDAAEHARELSDIEEVKRSRNDQISDATANNVSAVAKQMQTSGRTAGSAQVMRSEAGSDLPAELTEAEGSCIETGYHADKNIADMRRTHDRDCVNSGRVPIRGRCSLGGLSMICYGQAQDSEKITYVYSGTVAETYFRKTCAEADRVPASKVPPNGASFRDPAMKLAFTCAPSGSDVGGD